MQFAIWLRCRVSISARPSRPGIQLSFPTLEEKRWGAFERGVSLMIKGLTVSSLLIVALFLQPGIALAGTDVDVTIGGGYPPSPSYEGRYSRGPVYDDDGYENYDDDYGRISCMQGRRIVSRQGFYRVAPLQCSGRVFRYRAIRRHEPWTILVSARSGRIISARPMREY